MSTREKIIYDALKPETDLEKTIIRDPEFKDGLFYGRKRPGHPEGEVIWHIQEVFENVDKYSNLYNRTDLRIIALIHDTFKYKVDKNKPKSGLNHHAMIARQFAEKYHIDTDLLDIIELHDEAHACWKLKERKTEYHGHERAIKLIKRLGLNIFLYLTFFRCDNETGDKEPDGFEWFLNIVEESKDSDWFKTLIEEDKNNYGI